MKRLVDYVGVRLILPAHRHILLIGFSFVAIHNTWFFICEDIHEINYPCIFMNIPFISVPKESKVFMT